MCSSYCWEKCLYSALTEVGGTQMHTTFFITIQLCTTLKYIKMCGVVFFSSSQGLCVSSRGITLYWSPSAEKWLTSVATPFIKSRTPPWSTSPMTLLECHILMKQGAFSITPSSLFLHLYTRVQFKLSSAKG